MEGIFLDVLNKSITAGWLVLVIVVLRLVFAKAPKKIHCVLWIMVAVRLVCPFAIESDISLVPNIRTVTEGIFYEKEPDIETGVAAVDALVNPVIGTVFVVKHPENSVNPIRIFIDIGAFIWLAGIVVLTLYSLISWYLIHAKVREAVPETENIWLCDRAATPFILGIIRPRIYLPAVMAEADRKYVIAHEKAHLVRHDHWWKPLGFALLVFFWFHPLLWIAYHLFCRDMELACDEKVIDGMSIDVRKSYASALINCSASPKTMAACPLAFGEISVKKRVQSVLSYKKPAVWVSIVMAAVGILTAIAFLTNPSQTMEERLQNAIFKQDGYQILSQKERSIDIILTKDALPDAMDTYFDGKYEFPEDKVIVYETAGSTIYLESVNYENEDYLEFTFMFSYRIMNRGSMLVPYIMEYDEAGNCAYSNCIQNFNQTVTDASKLYEDARYFSGQDSRERFAVCIRADVFREAEEFVCFTVEGLNEITYQEE